MRFLLFAVILTGMGALSSLRASIITQETAGTLPNNRPFYGQSFTTPAGGPWNNVTFNFLTPTATPYAIGAAYIFTSAYSGTPSGLSSSSFLAESTSISAGQWVFDPTFVMQPNTQYFVYEDGTIPAGSIRIDNHQFGTGQLYSALPPTIAPTFAGLSTAAVNFQLSGATLAPEPATFGLLLAGAAVLVAGRRRRR